MTKTCTLGHPSNKEAVVWWQEDVELKVAVQKRVTLRRTEKTKLAKNIYFFVLLLLQTSLRVVTEDLI